MKIKKGDTVLIKKGKDVGKSGKVEKVLPASNKIIVAGINILKKNIRPSKKYPQGGIIDINAPISVSNVQLICPQCNKASKVMYVYSKNNKNKMRVCRKCKESVDLSKSKTK